MKRTRSNMAIFILMITLQCMSITHCADGGNNINPFPTSSRSREKLKKFIPIGEDSSTAELSEFQQRGEELTTGITSSSGQGTSRSTASSEHESSSRKRICKSNYRRWTDEMNEDLLRLYHEKPYKKTESWDEIENFFHEKYGENISRGDLQQHVITLVNRMVYNTSRPRQGRNRNDPRISLIRIYYQTKNSGDESGHNDRMHKKWMKDLPESQLPAIPDLKLYVEQKLKGIKKDHPEKKKKRRGITHCAENRYDPILLQTSSHDKGKLLEMHPVAKDVRNAESIQYSRKGKEVLTQENSLSEEETSRAASSSRLRLRTIKGPRKSGYRVWTNEMNEDLLSQYYRKDYKINETWDEIEDFFREKYGKDIIREELQQHLKTLVNRIVYRSSYPKKGRIQNDPRINLMKIYYRTKDGDELGHSDRMRQKWLEENPGSDRPPVRDPKSYVEQKLETIKRGTIREIRNESTGRRQVVGSFDWKPDHNEYLLKTWRSLPGEMKNKNRELHRIVSQEFLDLEQLTPQRLYGQVRNLLRKEKRRQKGSRHKDQTASSYSDIQK